MGQIESQAAVSEMRLASFVANDPELLLTEAGVAGQKRQRGSPRTP
jgi:hypothetical protein